jgi:hypothetical protein
MLQQYLWEIFTIIVAIVSLIMSMRDSSKVFFGLLVCCNGREKKLCKWREVRKEVKRLFARPRNPHQQQRWIGGPVSPSRVINNVSLAYRPYNFHEAEVRLEQFSLQVPVRPQAVFVCSI